MFVSLTRVCVVYIVKEVMSIPGLSQLICVARKKKTCAQALQKESCVAYVESGANS